MRAFQTSFPGVISELSTTLVNCNPRRLSDFMGSGSRRLSTPGLTASTTTSVPASQAASAQSTISGMSGSALHLTISTSMQSSGLGSLAPSSVQSVQAAPPSSNPSTAPQSTSSNPSGFSACYTGQACVLNFEFYTGDTHYKIHAAGANMPLVTCATACKNDANCEAFSSLGNGLVPSCTFWMNGACNIPAGNPPGLVNHLYVTTCEKTGTREEFAPVKVENGASRCKCDNTLGLPLAVLSAFLMAAVP